MKVSDATSKKRKKIGKIDQKIEKGEKKHQESSFSHKNSIPEVQNHQAQCGFYEKSHFTHFLVFLLHFFDGA